MLRDFGITTGISSLIFTTNCSIVPLEKGALPKSASYKMTPIDHKSAYNKLLQNQYIQIYAYFCIVLIC